MFVSSSFCIFTFGMYTLVVGFVLWFMRHQDYVNPRALLAVLVFLFAGGAGTWYSLQKSYTSDLDKNDTLLEAEIRTHRGSRIYA